MTREAEERAVQFSLHYLSFSLQMMERYFNDPRGPPPPHFDPSQLPPAAFRQFINSFGPEVHLRYFSRCLNFEQPMSQNMIQDFRNMNLSPAQEAQLRERARVLSSHFGICGIGGGSLIF